MVCLATGWLVEAEWQSGADRQRRAPPLLLHVISMPMISPYRRPRMLGAHGCAGHLTRCVCPSPNLCFNGVIRYHGSSHATERVLPTHSRATVALRNGCLRRHWALEIHHRGNNMRIRPVHMHSVEWERHTGKKRLWLRLPTATAERPDLRQASRTSPSLPNHIASTLCLHLQPRRFRCACAIVPANDI